jgi:hypothetical protein
MTTLLFSVIVTSLSGNKTRYFWPLSSSHSFSFCFSNVTFGNVDAVVLLWCRVIPTTWYDSHGLTTSHFLWSSFMSIIIVYVQLYLLCNGFTSPSYFDFVWTSATTWTYPSMTCEDVMKLSFGFYCLLYLSVDTHPIIFCPISIHSK